MQTSFFITIFAAALASGLAIDSDVKRGCYSGGGDWGADRALAQSKAAQACNDAFVGTDGTADFKKGDQMQKCYNLDSTKKVDFVLFVDEDDKLTSSFCYDGFNTQIVGCDKHGGDQDRGNFRFQSDPNDGQCA
ncbi:secreted protein [Seiridium cupressi]